ncbi:MAG: hypothetical protein WCR12_09985, partial [Dysgonamonadaceae bacterium]
MSFKQVSDKSGQRSSYNKDILFDNKEEKRIRSHKLIHSLPFFTSLLAVLIIIIDLGFLHNNTLRIIFNIYYNVVLLVGILTLSKPYFEDKKTKLYKTYLIDILLLTALILV